MGKNKKKKRPCLLKPNKRVPIEHRSTTMNATHKIRKEGKKKYLMQTLMGKDFNKFF